MTIREPGDSRRQERRRGMFATFAAVIAVGVLAVGVVMTVERASAPSDEFRVEIVSPSSICDRP